MDTYELLTAEHVDQLLEESSKHGDPETARACVEWLENKRPGAAVANLICDVINAARHAEPRETYVLVTPDAEQVAR